MSRMDSPLPARSYFYWGALWKLFPYTLLQEAAKTTWPWGPSHSYSLDLTRRVGA